MILLFWLPLDEEDKLKIKVLFFFENYFPSNNKRFTNHVTDRHKCKKIYQKKFLGKFLK